MCMNIQIHQSGRILSAPTMLQLFCSILKNQHPFGVYRKGVFICQNVDLVFISKTQLRAGLIFFVGVMKALYL